MRATGTRPEALSLATGIDAPRRVEREGPARARRAEAEGLLGGVGTSLWLGQDWARA